METQAVETTDAEVQETETQLKLLNQYYIENRRFFIKLSEVFEYQVGDFDLRVSIELLLNGRRNTNKLKIARKVVSKSVDFLKNHEGGHQHINFLESVEVLLQKRFLYLTQEEKDRREKRESIREHIFQSEFELFKKQIPPFGINYTNVQKYNSEIGHPLDLLIQQFLYTFDLEILPRDIRPQVLDWFDQNIKFENKEFQNRSRESIRFKLNENIQILLRGMDNPFIKYFK